MRVDLNLISSSVAKELSKHLVGLPSENRVLLALPDEEKKVGSIILPGNVTEGVPPVRIRKGGAFLYRGADLET